MTTYEKGKLYDINMNDLLSDPNQPRKVIDPQGLEELTASVTRHGVLMPILFRVETGGQISNMSPKRLSRSIQELSIVKDKSDQKALMQRSGELIPESLMTTCRRAIRRHPSS